MGGKKSMENKKKRIKPHTKLDTKGQQVI